MASNTGKKVVYPKPTQILTFKNFSFGSFVDKLGRGSGAMSVFFSDGIRSIGITQSKFLDACKQIDFGRTTGRISFISPAVPNYHIPGSTNEFISKYMKINLAVKSDADDYTKKNFQPKVLICQSRRLLVEHDTYENIDSFGIVVPLNQFLSARDYIHLTGKSETTLDGDDDMDF